MSQDPNAIAGMAYFVGTGPEGKTCCQCEEFLGKPRRTGVGKGDMQDGRCAKYVAMVRSAHGSRSAPSFSIPPETRACKYFRVAIFGPQTKIPRAVDQPPLDLSVTTKS